VIFSGWKSFFWVEKFRQGSGLLLGSTGREVELSLFPFQLIRRVYLVGSSDVGSSSQKLVMEKNVGPVL
jgi:hypothetical protein